MVQDPLSAKLGIYQEKPSKIHLLPGENLKLTCLLF
jgi:hypothetical protein